MIRTNLCRRRLLAAFGAAALLAAVGTPAGVADPLPTLYLIGDSTVNNHTAGQLGWGDPIRELFDPAKVRVENRARGGRSSRTYLMEGLWDAVAAQLKPGDFVLMQFGHNDGGSLTDSRGRASIKGNGDETREVTNAATGKAETVHTYGWYLRRYIADARAKGATWAAEAATSGGARFVDLNEIIARRYEADGKAKVQAEYFGPTDHTHTTPAGARVNAACVVEGVKALEGCALGKMVAGR
jgi:lysophospholipase L1-like esterase